MDVLLPTIVNGIEVRPEGVSPARAIEKTRVLIVADAT
jgi:hypothetical protein